MEVIDHEPQAWFLLRKDHALLLDVNCSHGAAGYDVLICLSPEEEADFAEHGRTYLDRLARMVQDTGPCGSYQRRSVSARYSVECTRAIEDWRRKVNQGRSSG